MGLNVGQGGRQLAQSNQSSIGDTEASWRHGSVDVRRYDPERGAAWYVSKSPEDVEIVGVMKRTERGAGGPAEVLRRGHLEAVVGGEFVTVPPVKASSIPHIG